ncbi:MAG: hypothetical protein ABI877_21025, partial [Gemmatimonadaceae bacterium]
VVAVCFFDRVEIGSLKVFYEREREHLMLVQIPNDGWNGGPPERSGCTESSLTSDQFIAVVHRSNRHGL